MCSIFNSFDFFYFFWQVLIFFFLFYLVFSFIFNSSFNYFLMTSNNFLENIFFKLKFLSFTKFILNYFIFLFIFIFFMNFFSVFSYSFPLTSQVSLVFWFSGYFWASLIIFSLFNNFKGMFSHFIPEGSPLPLSLFLFLIEIFSNLIRPLTLMIRLVSNILAGHLLLVLLSTLVFQFLPSFLFYVILNLVEIFVSFIQAYIFSVMLCLYFSEV